MNTCDLDSTELRSALRQLHAGDMVTLSGAVYTARDAAHMRILSALARGEDPPFELRDATIYYAGPTPARPGAVIGSCGPTTSSRMDAFAPELIARGLVCMIGKGGRGDAVIDAMRRHGAVYLCAIGGAGALAASCVVSCEEIAYPELGCESVKRLILRRMPLYVAIDADGASLFDSGPAAYREAVV